MGQSGFNEPQNPLPLPQEHKNHLVSRLCPCLCWLWRDTEALTNCCQLRQGVWAAKEQNNLFSYHVQIGEEWSQHGADKGFVVFWRAGEYQGLHKHTCTARLRKRHSNVASCYTAGRSPLHREAKRQHAGLLLEELFLLMASQAHTSATPGVPVCLPPQSLFFGLTILQTTLGSHQAFSLHA